MMAENNATATNAPLQLESADETMESGDAEIDTLKIHPDPGNANLPA